jgi:acetyltransferase-like isoleucine patch superfamily enzyme
VKIQNRVSIFKDCIVEDGVFIGPHVCITNDLRPRAINADGTLKSAGDWSAGSTHIEYGAAIGAGSIILPSRRIGRFAMIGAGSVVTRDVPGHVLVVGNPARPIGYVCACGDRLGHSSGASERFACQQCDAEYELLEDQSIRML